MELLRLNDLKGRDVYEFCYANNYPKHWSDDSLFLSTEDFSVLSSYLDSVYPNYHYYGPQKIMISEWEKIKGTYLCSENINILLSEFFISIDAWIKKDITLANHFWILGV